MGGKKHASSAVLASPGSKPLVYEGGSQRAETNGPFVQQIEADSDNSWAQNVFHSYFRKIFSARHEQKVPFFLFGGVPHLVYIHGIF